MQFEVPVADGTLWVDRRGRGFPVLFIHGWGLTHLVWEPQLVALSEQFQTVSWDRRGFGRSSAPASQRMEIGDILAIVSTLKLEKKFVLVGMSQGCRIAVNFALEHSDLVAALVLHGSPLSERPPDVATEPAIPFDLFSKFLMAGDLSRFRMAWRSHPLMAVNNADGARILDTIVSSYQAVDLSGTIGTLPLTSAMASNIAMPTLVLIGSAESAFRQWAAGILEQAIPQANLVTIENGGHLCNLCEPISYNRILASFIALHAKR